MRELIGMMLAVLLIFGASGAIFSAIRHRRSSVGTKGGRIGKGGLLPHIHVDAPMPPVRPTRRPTLKEVRAMPLSVDRDALRKLDWLTADLLMQTSPLETMARVHRVASRIVLCLLSRLNVGSIVGMGTMCGFEDSRAWDPPNKRTIVIVLDDDYQPSPHERVGFFGIAKEITRSTREKIRTKIDTEELIPVCPNCGKTIGVEVEDV